MGIEFGGQVLLVGAGKMGGALLSGMLSNGLKASNVLVQDPGPPDEIKEMLSRFGIVAETRPVSGESDVSIIILAVKPQLIEKVFPGVVANYVRPGTLVVSVAAGVTLTRLEDFLESRAAVVRVMPNTPAAIGRGMSVCCSNPNVNAEQRSVCDALLKSVGETAWVEDEAVMDAVTAVSGSGPAYVFYLAECLARAGVKAGLDEVLAMKLAVETIAGAGALLKVASEDAGTLRKNVTSPGGTTAAALEVLMAEGDGFMPLLEKAVGAAAIRSKELAG